jgi:hypothetical protein
VFLLETYVSRARAAELVEAAARARSVARRLAADGRRVRFVRLTFIPGDELGFLVFEAESAELVGEVATRAEITFERIVEAVE